MSWIGVADRSGSTDMKHVLSNLADAFIYQCVDVLILDHKPTCPISATILPPLWGKSADFMRCLLWLILWNIFKHTICAIYYLRLKLSSNIIMVHAICDKSWIKWNIRQLAPMSPIGARIITLYNNPIEQILLFLFHVILFSVHKAKVTYRCWVVLSG